MEAAPSEHVGRVADAFEEVGDEAGLADAGGSEQGEEPAGAVGDSVLVVAPETLAFALAPDERRLEVARKRSGIGKNLEQAEGFDRLRLPLQDKRLDGFHSNGVANENARLGADQRFAWRRSLLESRGDVDGVTGDERLGLAADDHFSRIHADACVEAVRGDRGAHLRGGSDGTKSIVLVRHGDPEDRHHRVADELLDRPTVTLDDRSQVLEVAAHARTERLRIRRFAERGRADEIAEENGDDLALLARRFGDGERGSARTAETRVVRVLPPAAGACRHARSLRVPH